MKKDQKKRYYQNYVFMSVLILLLFTSCPSNISKERDNNKRDNNKQENNQNNKDPEASYDEDTGIGKINNVNFKLNGIDVISSATLGRDDIFDNKKHKVKLSYYFMGETEVTQELWMAIMKKNPSTFIINDPADKTALQRPVETVTLYDCMAFCNELTKKVNNDSSEKCVYYSDNKYKDVYTKSDAANKKIGYMNKKKKGFRLPTEAEWEWAALGHTSSKWAGTDNEHDLNLFAWYDKNSKKTTHKVKEKRRNNFGLYDITGNVGEWTWGVWTPKMPDGQDPLPPAHNAYTPIIARGGSWDKNAELSDICVRERLATDFKDANVGLRIVCTY